MNRNNKQGAFSFQRSAFSQIPTPLGFAEHRPELTAES
jgi:hypothetical protein